MSSSKSNFLLVLLCLSASFLSGQISGTILSTEGDTLSFASIYIKGSTTGTSSNSEGKYELVLDPGKYELVYQYVGYQNLVKQVELTDELILLNVELTPEVYSLNTITLAADAEDPAYAIMRNAIAKRKYFKEQIESFSTDVYVKGNQKILSIPEKILGREVGDLDGALDKNRTGIVYLSETLSRYHFRQPNDYKEVVISSKISGDDSGYSFNSAREMAFNIYDNTLTLNREIVSPIANNALNYYEYKLEGTFYDDQNNLVNRVKVIPKRNNDPVFSGEIYIYEDIWNVHSLDLNLSSAAIQLAFLDSLNLNQVFLPLGAKDTYGVFSNTISFEIKLFGVHLAGQFAAIYSNYEINKPFPEGFFNNEVHRVEASSNKKDSSYWDEIRPVPLTLEEITDYKKKDSIQIVRKSPAYLDSIDKATNKFELPDLVFGYNRQNSKKNTELAISSPLNSIGFNTVQGYHLGTTLSNSKFYNENKTKSLTTEASINYGLSEKRWRGTLNFDYLFNHLSFSRITLNVGRTINQFNGLPAIPELYNSFYSLFYRKNYAKYYEKNFIKIGRAHEIFNGVYYFGHLEYAQRTALGNHSDHSYFFSDSRYFSSNHPTNDSYHGTRIFTKHESLGLNFHVRFSINQKYLSYPDKKFIEESAWPFFWLHFKSGLPYLGGDTQFFQLGASAKKRYALGVKGEIEFMLNGAIFLNNEEMTFADFTHFNGGQITLANPEHYLKTFLLMPYYRYSTNQNYIQAHLQHHFNGYIIDKIPLINKLGWTLVAGAKHLRVSGRHYSEAHLGIDKMGFGIFKVLRLDAVWSFPKDLDREFGLRLGFGLDN